jgi:dsRNA-specific ribonuclease
MKIHSDRKTVSIKELYLQFDRALNKYINENRSISSVGCRFVFFDSTSRRLKMNRVIEGANSIKVANEHIRAEVDHKMLADNVGKMTIVGGVKNQGEQHADDQSGDVKHDCLEEVFSGTLLSFNKRNIETVEIWKSEEIERALKIEAHDQAFKAIEFLKAKHDAEVLVLSAEIDNQRKMISELNDRIELLVEEIKLSENCGVKGIDVQMVNGTDYVSKLIKLCAFKKFENPVFKVRPVLDGSGFGVKVRVGRSIGAGYGQDRQIAVNKASFQLLSSIYKTIFKHDPKHDETHVALVVDLISVETQTECEDPHDEFIRELITPVESKNVKILIDSKNKLQELCQSKGFEMPVYKTVVLGTPQNPLFESEVSIESYRGIGRARTKKDSEKKAALEVLSNYGEMLLAYGGF